MEEPPATLVDNIQNMLLNSGQNITVHSLAYSSCLSHEGGRGSLTCAVIKWFLLIDCNMSFVPYDSIC